MLQLTSGIGLGMDIGNLLELQAALQASGVIHMTANEIGVLGVAKQLCIIPDDINLLGLENLLDLLRQLLQGQQQTAIFLIGNGAQSLGHIQCENIHNGQLGGIRLGGCHGDFRAGPGVDYIVRLFGDGGAHHIDNGHGSSPTALCLSESGQGIGGLTGLGDDQHQGIFVAQGITVAELGSQHGLHGNPAQLLHHILAHAAHIIGAAAGHHIHPGELFDVIPIQGNIIQHNSSVPNSGGNGIGKRLGLLVDLLNHKMVIAVLLGGGELPINVLGGLLQFISLAVIEMDGIGGHFHQLVIVQIHHLTGIPEHSGDIRRYKVAAVTIAKDHGTGFFGRHNGVGIVLAQGHEGIAALDLIQRRLHGIQQRAAAGFQAVGDQVTGHLGIRLGLEGIALLQEHGLDVQIVFHNAVVNQRNPSVAAEMGMGIDIRRGAMGCPTGMTNPNIAGHICAVMGCLHQVRQPPLLFGDMHLAARAGADAGRIITSIFQLTKAIQQHGGRRGMASKSNNTTHNQKTPSAASSPRIAGHHKAQSITLVGIVSYDYILFL